MSRIRNISRADFVKMLLAGMVCLPTVAGAVDPDKLRGDRVGWTRLKTSSPAWYRHTNGDPKLTRFFRDQTTLNIDLPWYVADVENLGEMSKYPVLFSQGVHVVNDGPGRSNLVEYIRRGGFLLVDACCNPDITPDFDVFLQQHLDFFATALPESNVSVLPSDHDVYHCNFPFPQGQPPHSFMNNVYDAKKAAHGLYGVMIGQRMAGLVSLSGLQCGWESPDKPRGHDILCMKMLVNIYIYAMTQGV